MRRFAIIGLLAVGALLLVAGIGHSSTGVRASSHREAPLIAFDPQADNTDVYAFTSPDKPDTVTIVANYIPLEIPGGAPDYYRFGDDVLYSIHIDNTGGGSANIRYDFQFKTTITNPNTILYATGPVTSIDDPNLIIKQTYTVTRTDAGGQTVIASNLPVAPANIGGLAFPNYDAVGNQAIKQAQDGTMFFAGQRADPFFVDVGAIFDLLNIRKVPGNMGGGVNALAGINTHSIVMQLPKGKVTSNGANPTDPKQSSSIIGVWATASRQSVSVLSGPQNQVGAGNFIQVSRLGNPLFNEVIIPRGFKDQWNASTPQQSIAVDVKNGGDPELAVLINKIYGIKVPPQPSTGGPPRDDLAAIFLTGVPGATMPAGVTPAEELRLNLAVPPTAAPNRMGVLGGDLQGFPNGRRLADDVVDIEEQAVAGAAYPLFHMDYKPDPLATQLGDGVDGPDKPYLPTFPYVASPYSGDTGPFGHK